MTRMWKCDSCGKVEETENPSAVVSKEVSECSYKNWHICSECFAKLKLPEVSPF